MAHPHGAPAPAELIHLRPDDRTGFLVVGLALAGTTAGIALSLVDSWVAG